MRPTELQNFLENKLPEFIKNGGVLVPHIWKKENYCCPLGAINFLSGQKEPEFWSCWAMNEFGLNRKELYAFIAGINNKNIECPDSEWEIEFNQVGKYINEKFMLKNNFPS